MTNISRPHFLSQKPSEKNGIVFPAIKRERFIFVKNVFSKKFLKSCKDHKKLQHYRAMTNISRPHFLSKTPSEKNGMAFTAFSFIIGTVETFMGWGEEGFGVGNFSWGGDFSGSKFPPWDVFKNLGQKSAFLGRFKCLLHH